jgi:hypothetical protein
MATLTLPEVFDLRLKLQDLEGKKDAPELSLFERCDLEDEILQIKEKLGQFDRQKFDDTEECINCSG